MAYKDKAQASKYIYQYTKDNYDRVSLTLPKGMKKEILQKHESINGYINKLIADDMGKEEK